MPTLIPYRTRDVDGQECREGWVCLLVPDLPPPVMWGVRSDVRQFFFADSSSTLLHTTHERIVDSRQCCRILERNPDCCFRRTSKCSRGHCSRKRHSRPISDALRPVSAAGRPIWPPMGRFGRRSANQLVCAAVPETVAVQRGRTGTRRDGEYGECAMSAGGRLSRLNFRRRNSNSAQVRAHSSSPPGRRG